MSHQIYDTALSSLSVQGRPGNLTVGIAVYEPFPFLPIAEFPGAVVNGKFIVPRKGLWRFSLSIIASDGGLLVASPRVFDSIALELAGRWFLSANYSASSGQQYISVVGEIQRRFEIGDAIEAKIYSSKPTLRTLQAVPNFTSLEINWICN